MKKRVYIADDDDSLIDMLTVYLELIGYEATGSTRLIDLILLENLPHVFLLNIRVWGEESDMISSYLKNQQLTERIPIILLSTADNPIRCIPGRYADGIISIPYEVHKLPGLLTKITS